MNEEMTAVRVSYHEVDAYKNQADSTATWDNTTSPERETIQVQPSLT